MVDEPSHAPQLASVSLAWLVASVQAFLRPADEARRQQARLADGRLRRLRSAIIARLSGGPTGLPTRASNPGRPGNAGARYDPKLPDEIATRSPLARSWKAFETALDQLITETAIKTA